MIIHYQIISVETVIPYEDKRCIVTIKLTPVNQKYPRNFSDITLTFDGAGEPPSFECGQRFELKAIES